MNVINRVELAIRRAASQMPSEISPLFKLLADELQGITHAMEVDEVALKNYRREQYPDKEAKFAAREGKK